MQSILLAPFIQIKGPSKALTETTDAGRSILVRNQAYGSIPLRLSFFLFSFHCLPSYAHPQIFLKLFLFSYDFFTN